MNYMSLIVLMDSQAIHCLDQIIRFSQMLESDTNERPRDTIIAQLSFNLGRYVEIMKCDGRMLWRFLESNIIDLKFNNVRLWAENQLKR